MRSDLSGGRDRLGVGQDVEGVELAVADWVAPEWSREPEEAPAVAGGGDGDWFEEAMAALPAVGAPAPAIEGLVA